MKGGQIDPTQRNLISKSLQPKVTCQESLRFTDSPMKRQQAVGFLTRKQHENAGDAFRAVFIFSLKTFYITQRSF